ncbi:MAG: hypothetical protein A2W62_03180 [Alphaproteobacteria bacterium RIFCSPLOWO2_02_42_7]|nr:MAG: hypothetical protein A2W62_03180 [Alphaproteobacteria bacterium RIFCSPLOWO2_02_42_7]
MFKLPLFVLSLCLWQIPSAYADTRAHVAVGQIVEHPALNSLREGLKKGLEQQGFVEGKNLEWTYENAQGNPTTAVQISKKLVSLNPNVIVTLSTPMTQAVLTVTSSIPIVFGAVTDPVTAKLTGHQNVTGLTDFVPPEKQLELVKTFFPQVKAIGVVYNSGEANSVKQVQDLKEVAQKQNIIIIESTISKSSDVSSATKTLVGKVDAILLPTDNTVITALESIIKIGETYNIPVFGSDVDIVKRGATAAYGVNWTESGLSLAETIAKILKGVPVNPLPIQDPPQLLFYINLHAAKKAGINVPDSLQKRADMLL